MKSDEYAEFCGGYVQIPASLLKKSGLKGTKKGLAEEFRTDYNVIRRITNEHFPCVLSLQQAFSDYANDRIEIWSDGYYEWFLTLCLSRFFRRPGSNKVNHAKLKKWIKEYPSIFSWEVFYLDVSGYIARDDKTIEKIGQIRFSDQQIKESYYFLQEIRKNETPRFNQPKRNQRAHLTVVPK